LRPYTVPTSDKPSEQSKPAKRKLSPAAERALAEAEARRKEYLEKEAARPKEIGGRGGLEPGRYGDWEVKGLTSDF
jgi:hypothetical protein